MNYSKTFDIDFNKLGQLLTPIFWRNIIFLDWIYCFIRPVKNLHNEFKAFREKSIYKIVHNGQVILLEKVLNDAFDREFKRIYISDSLINEPLYIYTELEARPVYLGLEYLYDFDVFEETNIDFYIIMPLADKPADPVGLQNIENRIKAITNYYKLASKRYIIKWI